LTPVVPTSSPMIACPGGRAVISVPMSRGSPARQPAAANALAASGTRPREARILMPGYAPPVDRIVVQRDCALQRMLCRSCSPRLSGPGPKEEVITVKVFWGILAFVAILPVLLIIGIAAGPAGLVILFLIGCALLVMTVERMQLRHVRRKRTVPLHK